MLSRTSSAKMLQRRWERMSKNDEVDRVRTTGISDVAAGCRRRKRERERERERERDEGTGNRVLCMLDLLELVFLVEPMNP